MRTLVLFILIILNIHHALSKKCAFSAKVEVHIVSNLNPTSPPLQVHCKSREDDLGNHMLSVNQDYNWSFCNGFFETTLFYCNIRTGEKQLGFQAFASGWRENCTKNVCNWAAKEDGIYFNGQKKDKWIIRCC